MSIYQVIGNHYPDLGKLGRELDQQVFTQPHTTVIKSRMYAERLIELMIAQIHAQPNELQTYREQIDYLQNHAEIDKKIYKTLDKIRRFGNLAAHEGLDDEVGAALEVNRHLFVINCWFIEMYLDQTFQKPEYVTPVPKSEPSLDLDDRLLDAVLQRLQTDFTPHTPPVEPQLTPKKAVRRGNKQLLDATDIVPEGKYAGKVVADVHRAHPFYFAEWFCANKTYAVDLEQLTQIYTPTGEQRAKHKARQMQGKTVLTLDDCFPTGKYVGQSIRAVHEQHPDYIRQWFNKSREYYIDIE